MELLQDWENVYMRNILDLENPQWRMADYSLVWTENTACHIGQIANAVMLQAAQATGQTPKDLPNYGNKVYIAG